ncbi:hypothetical protein F0562_013990 [Nyssa sinensis]|uniref:Uncharacterized protein n=1 Tax=Nyssa sinensis TaxID=561372 RepID=A0A5J4ZPG0_9ASTE|nr:hypothetical protein F0562_013990 [Nyssa sinensis]
MFFQKEHLDLVLVPSALIIMFGYHLFFLYRCITRPHTTVIGFENNDKKAWVDKIMQIDKKDIGIALTVLSSNISAATFLSSVCLTLSSLIAAWMANDHNNIFQSKLIYGDTKASHHVHQVHKPPDMLPLGLFMLHSINKVLYPCKLSSKHTR